jgi:AraC-like DNA-binding protein
MAGHGLAPDRAEAFLAELPVWTEARIQEAAAYLRRTFYALSGWKPELMEENRLRLLQQAQLNQAIEDQRRNGQPALYAFEKERMLLAHIRAGDRTGARRVLNEMLATIYLSSPRLVVLRARAVELMSCLTRAAIEDNPLLEPLIERNHTWTERLVTASDFEALSQELMEALDSFIEDIYLQGVNRRNAKVSQALEYIGRRFAEKIALREVAREVKLSPSRLAHLFREYTGRSVLQMVIQTRIRHAQQLLERTARSCTEIGYEVGFQDQSHFIKHFKRLAGVTPRQFRSGKRPGA